MAFGLPGYSLTKASKVPRCQWSNDPTRNFILPSYRDGWEAQWKNVKGHKWPVDKDFLVIRMCRGNIEERNSRKKWLTMSQETYPRFSTGREYLPTFLLECGHFSPNVGKSIHSAHLGILLSFEFCPFEILVILDCVFFCMPCFLGLRIFRVDIKVYHAYYAYITYSNIHYILCMVCIEIVARGFRDAAWPTGNNHQERPARS